MIADKNSFLAFICMVVNIATQEKKSDRIKTVVNVAEEFLGFQNVRAEDINGMLKINNDWGSQIVI